MKPTTRKLPSGRSWRAIAAVAVLAVALAGCVVQDTRPMPPVVAEKATAEIPQDELLDVGIHVFDPNIPAGSPPRNISANTPRWLVTRLPTGPSSEPPGRLDAVRARQTHQAVYITEIVEQVDHRHAVVLVGEVLDPQRHLETRLARLQC